MVMNELRKSNSLNNLSKLVLDDLDAAQQPQRLSLMDKKRQKWSQELSEWWWWWWSSRLGVVV